VLLHEGVELVEFGDDIGSVTVTGTDEDVEITTEGGATVVDVEAQERARREAVATCKGDLPGHGGKFGFDLGFGEPFEGPFGKAPHGLFEEFFGEFFEEFELEVEPFGLDADELRRERLIGPENDGQFYLRLPQCRRIKAFVKLDFFLLCRQKRQKGQKRD
jgi:hypothetical protein